MPLIGWILFNLFIIAILALDLVVFHKKARAISLLEGSLWSLGYIVLALLFNGYIALTMGKEAGINFLTGYLIEKSLSVDNLFVFLLIFSYFRTPQEALHKVLFWGILGAIVGRAVFILLGVTLIQKFHWIIYVFGLFLIITGLKFAFQKDKQISPEKNIVVRLFNSIFRTTKEYDGDRFFIVKNSKLFATPLFVVLLAIETADLIFAIDSIPAVLAITYDPFIVYTSNIFAILGLRSLFFVLSGMLAYFVYLHYGIAFILIFVGLKMVLSEWIVIPPLIALAVIIGILGITILFSVLYGKRKGTP